MFRFWCIYYSWICGYTFSGWRFDIHVKMLTDKQAYTRYTNRSETQVRLEWDSFWCEYTSNELDCCAYRCELNTSKTFGSRTPICSTFVVYPPISGTKKSGRTEIKTHAIIHFICFGQIDKKRDWSEIKYSFILKMGQKRERHSYTNRCCISLSNYSAAIQFYANLHEI